MKRYLKYSILFLLIISFVSIIAYKPDVSVFAMENDDKSFSYIYDKARLLSSDEKASLEEISVSYGKEAGIGIYILTHDDPDAVDAEKYLEDFYDRGNYGDSVFLIIDMYNRDIVLMGFGIAETYLHSKRLDLIRDTITPYLSDGEYYEAFEIYIKESAKYMSDDSQLNYDHDYSYDQYGNHYSETSGQSSSFLTNIWFQLIASVGIGAIVVGVMAASSGGTMTAGGNTYLDSSRSGLIGRRDQYLRTKVTRVRKPQNNNNNGKGGFNSSGFKGGVSSGGHSHSTSRGKF